MSDTQEQAQPAAAQPASEQPVAETPAAEAPVAEAAAAPVAGQPKTVFGVGFLVMAFTGEKAADQALDEMKRAKSAKQFYFEEAAVIRQDAKGKVHYHETGDMSTGRGAGIGALVGGVMGVLGGPAGVALGAGIGATVGAAFTSTDKGFRNESLNTVGVALKPGTSAVVAITSSDFLKAVQKEVPISETRETVANLAGEISARLNEGKDLAIGILLTEEGLAIKKIAVNEESAEVVSAVITSDAIAYGSAIATADGVAYEAVAATAEGVVYEIGAGNAEGGVVETGVITDEGAVIVQAVALPEAAEATAGENKAPAEKDAAAAEPPAGEAPAAA